MEGLSGLLVALGNHSTAISIAVLTVVIWRMSRDVRDIKIGVVWQDEFKQFEKRFKTLEERVNNKLNGSAGK